MTRINLRSVKPTGTVTWTVDAARVLHYSRAGHALGISEAANGRTLELRIDGRELRPAGGDLVSRPASPGEISG